MQNKFLETEICLKIIKYMTAIIITLILALTGSWGYFTWYNAQWEYEVFEYEVDSGEGGGHAIINGEGEVNINGNSEKNDTKKN